jgi:hypothetical protein
MRCEQLEHRFVTTAPAKLDPGVLYISLEYGTALHLCCCGCGVETVTPFGPNEWRMTYDGTSVSLWPSIGNRRLKCQSHYVVAGGKAIFMCGEYLTYEEYRAVEAAIRGAGPDRWLEYDRGLDEYGSMRVRNEAPESTGS